MVDVPIIGPLVDVLYSGSLKPNTTMYSSASAGNAVGSGEVAIIVRNKTSNDFIATHCMDLTIPKVSDAAFYDIFLSSNPQPKWVGRITEQERANGCVIYTYGIVKHNGNAPGTVRICVEGHGVQTSDVPIYYIGEDKAVEGFK
jgi:hypothetical protein